VTIHVGGGTQAALKISVVRRRMPKRHPDVYGRRPGVSRAQNVNSPQGTGFRRYDVNIKHGLHGDDLNNAMADLIDKTPPQALEAEMAVLGAMLIEREAQAKVLDLLDERSFYKPATSISSGRSPISSPKAAPLTW